LPISLRLLRVTSSLHGYREFSLQWLVDEMSELASLGASHVTIFDDVFTLNTAGSFSSQR